MHLYTNFLLFQQKAPSPPWEEGVLTYYSTAFVLFICTKRAALFREQRRRQIPVARIGQQRHDGLARIFRKPGQLHRRMHGRAG